MHSRVVSVEGSVCHCGWEAAMASQQLRSSQPYRSSLQELPAMRTTVPVAHCATNLDKYIFEFYTKNCTMGIGQLHFEPNHQLREAVIREKKDFL